MESNGKGVDIDGNPLPFEVGGVGWPDPRRRARVLYGPRWGLDDNPLL